MDPLETKQWRKSHSGHCGPEAGTGPCDIALLQFADTDNILTDNQTLKLLIERQLPVVAPMLDSQTYYSNFWCGITPQVRLGEASGAPRPWEDRP